MLILEHICYKGEEGRSILKDINLIIEPGKLIAITGPNGGGKSTLARIIAGVLKPSSGKIFFYSEDITELNITDRAQKGISFGFQQPVHFKGITVYDLICMAAGETLSTINASCYLSEVGLCARDYINRELSDKLSGGEIKRIEIATIIARNTTLSILDEPEAGIDLWSFNHLIEVFKKMHSNKKATIIIISHQQRILEIADEIIAMVDGEIIKYGLKDKVLEELLNCTDPSRCKYCQNVLEDNHNE